MNEERIEQIIGALLRVGVTLAAAVVIAGGAVYLCRHGQEHPHYTNFHGVPDELKHPGTIWQDVWSGRGRAFIQLGLLLLISTPVVRVGFSIFAFAMQRDWTYVAITLLVLAVLLYSLTGGG